jgi:hypothetical protein
MSKLFGSFFIILFLNSNYIVGNQNDFGIWGSVAISHQLTRTLSISLLEELRMNRNASTIDSYFTDLGLEYQMNSWRLGINYRHSTKNELEYYGVRNRFYFDVAFKHKFKKTTVTLRQRFQEQFTEYFTSEEGKIPEWYSRTKVQAKLDLNKKYSPYVSFEIYYLIDNIDEIDNLFDRVRCETGFTYEFNRKHQYNLFYLVQQDLTENSFEFIVGIGYQFTL